MMKTKVGHTNIELIRGDISAQKDISAVVNAANAQLTTGGGVAGALHRAAGPELAEAGRPLAPISPGEAVITGAFNLPNDYVIHCLSPVYGKDKPSDKLLADCYRNALKIAEDKKIESIAFPAISTGAFGYPIDEATEIALKTVTDVLKKSKQIRLVRFVLFSDKDRKVYEEKIKNIL